MKRMVIAMIMCAALVGCGSANSSTSSAVSSAPAPTSEAAPAPTSAPPAATETPTPAPAADQNTMANGTATKAMYDQVQTGMTYEQVKAIFGKDGEETFSASAGGTESKNYLWYGTNLGSSASISFTNNAVTAKSQAGLS